MYGKIIMDIHMKTIKYLKKSFAFVSRKECGRERKRVRVTERGGRAGEQERERKT